MRSGWAIFVLAACSFSPGTLPGTIDDADTNTPDTGSTGDASVDAPSVSCPAAYSEAHGASRYRAGSGSWYEGQEACAAEGTHLARIDSSAENAFVLGLDPDGDIWIGMSDHLVEGEFRWLDGVLVGTGSSWQAGQPNDAGGAEDCGEINAGGGWNDNGCGFAQTYVCECDGVAPSTTPTWCQTGTDQSCDSCDDDCDNSFDEAGDGMCVAAEQLCIDTGS